MKTKLAFDLQNIELFNYETQQQCNTTNLCYYRQQDSLIKEQLKKCKKTRYSHEKATDSSKSEEGAATTIQAMYRGYKARKKYDEVGRKVVENSQLVIFYRRRYICLFFQIKRTSSEEKQNTKRIAELLSAPVSQKLHRPLEPIKVSNSLASQSNRENRIQQSASLRKKEGNRSNLMNQQSVSEDLEGLQVRR